MSPRPSGLAANSEARWTAERIEAREWSYRQWRQRVRDLESGARHLEETAGWIASRLELLARAEDEVAELRRRRAARGGPAAGNAAAGPFTPVHPARPAFAYRADAPTLRPLVSIITPFLDPGRQFAETAQSVFSQSLQAWEWIVVDDGSTDPVSLAGLAAVAAADRRVRVVRHETNRGISAARNTGFREARADYVLQLDADDLLEPTTAEKWLWHLETHPEAAFVNGLTHSFGVVDGVWDRGFDDAEAFLHRNLVGGRGLVRREVHRIVGGYDEEFKKVLEDWEFWLRCANAGYWGRTLREVGDWQRRRGPDIEQWPVWDGGMRETAARAAMHARYAGLIERGIPVLERRQPEVYEPVPDTPPFVSQLGKRGPRILLLLPWLAYGGSDRFNLDLIGQLADRGWECTVATTLASEDPWREEFLRLTPDLFMLHRFLRRADYPRFLRYLIESRRPDVVLVSHSELGYQLLPTLRAWCPEPLYLDYVHIHEPGWKGGGYPRISTLFHRQLDLSIASHTGLRDWLTAHGAEPERVEVAYSGIDAERFRPDAETRRAVRARLGIAPEEPVLLFAGRLCEQKCPGVLGRTLVALAERGVGFTALIAGDGEEAGALAELLRAHHLAERVRLLGALPNDEVRDLMRASDIFFLPSRREGIALAIFEAMACGLVVVATDVGGQRELVVEGTGELLPPGDDEAAVERFATALAAWIRDPERRARVGPVARRRILDGFASAAMGERMVQHFARAAALRARAPRSAVEPEFGNRLAEQALEFTRLEEVADFLWRERERAARSASTPPSPPPSDGPVPPPGAGARLFGLLKRTSEPIYVWGIRRGWAPWLVPIKEGVKRRLLRRGLEAPAG